MWGGNILKHLIIYTNRNAHPLTGGAYDLSSEEEIKELLDMTIWWSDHFLIYNLQHTCTGESDRVMRMSAAITSAILTHSQTCIRTHNNTHTHTLNSHCLIQLTHLSSHARAKNMAGGGGSAFLYLKKLHRGCVYDSVTEHLYSAGLKCSVGAASKNNTNKGNHWNIKYDKVTSKR